MRPQPFSSVFHTIYHVLAPELAWPLWLWCVDWRRLLPKAECQISAHSGAGLGTKAHVVMTLAPSIGPDDAHLICSGLGSEFLSSNVSLRGRGARGVFLNQEDFYQTEIPSPLPSSFLLPSTKCPCFATWGQMLCSSGGTRRHSVRGKVRD